MCSVEHQQDSVYIYTHNKLVISTAHLSDTNCALTACGNVRAAVGGRCASALICNCQ